MKGRKAIWRLAAITLLQATNPFLSARAESGPKEVDVASALVFEAPASAVSAQTSPASPPFHFRHLTAADGLSDSALSSAVQDPQGFMWFGTERGGLNRYDGCEFKIYQNE